MLKSFFCSALLLVLCSPLYPDEPAAVEKNVMVAMTDGVRLSTNIYLPAPEGSFPTLLMRTPYNKNHGEKQARFFAGDGYAVVVQDCRGRVDSEGEFYPYATDGRDGFDTQEWVGKQSWSNGVIGTFGGSYVGATQWLAAPYGSRFVKAMAPVATFTNFYNNLYLGGALRVKLISRWSASMTAPVRSQFEKIDFHQACLHLPLHRMDELFGWEVPMLRDMVFNNTYGSYWKKLGVEDQLHLLDLPAYHIVGIYDFFDSETIKSYKMMVHRAKTEHARRNQKLVLGPWDHSTIGSLVGEVDFGPKAALDMDAELKRWFDRHLKGVDNGIDREPPVRYFVMGLNDWRLAYRWPPQATRHVDYFLASGGHANTLDGDGTLSKQVPTDSGEDTFVSDPEQPIPSKGGKDAEPSYVAHLGPWDQRGIEKHPNVLVYTSPPLVHDIEVAGPVTATLYLATDAKDTDVAVKLVDVFPDGFAQNVASGILRGRFRESNRDLQLLVPGKIYEWRVDLTHTSNRFLKGHRIRLDVTGSNFPIYDRNPNTGGGPEDTGTFASRQELFHSRAHPSRVTLPVSTAY
jgi:putative CocE/NonD family hydrolase